MFNTVFKTLAVALLCVWPLSARAQGPVVYHGPVAKVLRGVGHELKRTFYEDFREHPVGHGLNLAARMAFILADGSSTCVGLRRGFEETNPILGRRPGCPKVLALDLGYTLLTEPLVNHISHDFEDSCKRDASDPNSSWNKVDAHTYSTRGCYWGSQLGFTIAVGAVEAPVIAGNIRLLEKK